jgi:hypothetical protein
MEINKDPYGRRKLLTGYFVWKRRLDTRALTWLAAVFLVAEVFANPLYPRL